MKEPITGRDLFIISTLCTGFGVLLAWGLFYRWGSLPPSKPIDWPAWIQAVGSVVGIFAAVAVAWWQQRKVHQALTASQAETELARHVRANRIFERFQKRIDRQLNEARDLGSMGGKITAVEVPEEVRELERELHVLSGAGSPGFTAITAFDSAQDLIRDGGISPANYAEFIECLKFGQAQCKQALSKIRVHLREPASNSH